MGVPTRLGRYVVRRRVGSGGFATVYLAHDEQLDAEVAIKVLADNWGHDDSVRHRFLEEGRFLRRVESEHVVQVHDVGELEDGRPFLVLTYADRGTLADRLKQQPLALPNAVDVVVQVGRGLQALHRRGLLHRDVKPANVLFRSTDDGERAVLSDLGLGKSLDEVSRITMPGGTPSYVAPEQAMGERLDERADQYSLGAVAYAALTGRSPHQVDGLGAASRVEVAPPPSSLGFDVPSGVDAAIVRALDPDREKRWPDVATFTRELVGMLDETTHDFPIRETVHLAPPLDAGEKTALSDANKPTIIKPEAAAVAEDSSGEAASEALRAAVEAAAEEEAAAEAAAEAETQQVAARKPKRKRARWVIAAVLALVVGGGAGYYGQRYLADREDLTVARGDFSVQLPRHWAQSLAESTWQPAGDTEAFPALRVSSGTGEWTTAAVPGIFVGVADSKLTLPASSPFQCGKDDEPLPGTTSSGQPTTDRISTDCGGKGTVLFQRVVDRGNAGSMLVQVIVPGTDESRAAEIANSVQFFG